MVKRKNKLSIKKNKKGFTLLELLLYISMSAVILFFSFAFLSTLQEAKIKNQTIAEVDQQGIQAVELMTQTLRNAQTINSPLAGAAGTNSFSVNTPTALNNPTIFDIANGKIRMTQGNGSPVDLTSSRVTASGMFCDNLSRTATNGLLRFQFTLTYNNNSGRNEYDYAKTFYSSVSLR